MFMQVIDIVNFHMDFVNNIIWNIICPAPKVANIKIVVN